MADVWRSRVPGSAKLVETVIGILVRTQGTVELIGFPPESTSPNCESCGATFNTVTDALFAPAGPPSELRASTGIWTFDGPSTAAALKLTELPCVSYEPFRSASQTSPIGAE